MGNEARSQLSNSSTYLLQVGNWAMLIVLGLIFTKTSEVVASAVSEKSGIWTVWPYVATITAIMVVMIGIVASIAYVHGDIQISYRRYYLLIDLLAVALPVYIALECIQRAASVKAGYHIEAGLAPDGAETLFRVGMVELAIMFIALLCRGLAVVNDFPPDIKRLPYMVFIPFHVAGVVATLMGAWRPDLVYYGGPIGLGLSFLFVLVLIFFWAFDVTLEFRLK